MGMCPRTVVTMAALHLHFKVCGCPTLVLLFTCQPLTMIGADSAERLWTPYMKGLLSQRDPFLKGLVGEIHLNNNKEESLLGFLNLTSGLLTIRGHLSVRHLAFHKPQRLNLHMQRSTTCSEKGPQNQHPHPRSDELPSR